MYGAQIADLEQRLISLSASQQRLERIRSLFERVKALRDAWIRENQKTELLGQLDLTKVGRLIEKVDKIKALSLFYNQITYYRRVFEHQNKLSELLKPIDLSVIPILTEKVVSLKIVKDLAVRFEKNGKELINKTNELQQSEQQYIEAADAYTKLLQGAGVCPICNRSTSGVEV